VLLVIEKKASERHEETFVEESRELSKGVKRSSRGGKVVRGIEHFLPNKKAAKPVRLMDRGHKQSSTLAYIRSPAETTEKKM